MSTDLSCMGISYGKERDHPYNEAMYGDIVGIICASLTCCICVWYLTIWLLCKN